ncbi:hypothetical protein F0562_022527 [Nyssa sinensis]|uniref:Apyrase 6 n=1 Tax=Nyssa sinensis TaxID=561372 RepID=A0A5J5BMT2_9ASTE|nr:hypothetical protein F0562_022527 [Nyssa sinensis]
MHIQILMHIFSFTNVKQSIHSSVYSPHVLAPVVRTIAMDLSNLQSRVSSAYIPPHRTQLHPRMHPFSSLSPPNNPPKLHSNRDKWLILAASLFVVPFLFYLFTIARGVHQSSKFGESKPKLFGIIIDASPTGSRIHVFEFLNEGMTPFIGLDGTGSSSLKVRPGLTRFADDPDSAGRSILGLIEFAKKRVPKSEWKNTKVQLMGTRGLEKLGLDSRESILESCRRVLRSSGFLFKDEWAAIIEGQEEGLYAWVAANYALGTLGGEPQETTGIVQLGGASMQVAFAPRDPPPVKISRRVKLAGVAYNLYIQSIPHFGQDAVWESLGEIHHSRDSSMFSSSREVIAGNPCIPRGYDLTSNTSDANLLASQPVGNFSACKSEVMASLKKRQGKCVHPPCEIVSNFLVELLGKTVPPEKFFYISELFGLVPKASLFELEAAGLHYCEDDWHKLKNLYPSIDDMDLLRYCFSSAYIVALLHESLGIAMIDNRIGFANQTGNTPLDWTFGAFILQTMLEPLELETDNLGEIVGNDAVTYFSLFAVLLIAVLGAFFVLKWQKPQLKTIYDLEKGRYIVTRMRR